LPKPIPIPHFDNEKQLTADSGRVVCGIDEAGRGPLAGPIVAAAVIIPVEEYDAAWVRDLRDSKMLSLEAREGLYDQVVAHCAYGIGQASVDEIDSVNILQATFLAMCRARAALAYDDNALIALIDGNQRPKGLTCEIVTLVKGDQKSCSIAAASILAKVTRDRVMNDLCAQYPMYGFSGHAGYGTPQHLKALAEHGPCPHHRKSFKPVAGLLVESQLRSS
jgi:ribonuclease HII